MVNSVWLILGTVTLMKVYIMYFSSSPAFKLVFTPPPPPPPPRLCVGVSVRVWVHALYWYRIYAWSSVHVCACAHTVLSVLVFPCFERVCLLVYIPLPLVCIIFMGAVYVFLLVWKHLEFLRMLFKFPIINIMSVQCCKIYHTLMTFWNPHYLYTRFIVGVHQML